MPPRSPSPEPDAAARGGPVAPHAAAALAAECGIALVEELHVGAFVDVYRGRRAGGADVAVKLTNVHGRQAGAAALVERERRVLEHIDHPHVVRVLGGAERDGAAVLALEYLPAGDLVPLGGASPRYWSAAALGVASALDSLHRAGVVHGDVKARNVRFDRSGRAKLIDFGSAVPIGRRLPRGGRTPAHEPLRFAFEHARPEQDVYAFAVLLYELVSGRLPFGAEPARFAEPRPLDDGGSRGLCAMAARVAAALRARNPTEIGTLLEFADVLESVQDDAARGSA
jgi:serine/threonine protein kinase